MILIIELPDDPRMKYINAIEEGMERINDHLEVCEEKAHSDELEEALSSLVNLQRSIIKPIHEQR